MITHGAVQSAYPQYLPIAQNGMPGSMSGWDSDTRICEDLSSPKVGVGFGLAVSQGTLHGDRSAVLGTLSGSTFVGITMANPTLPNLGADVGSFTDKYQDGENMAVMVRGDIWVIVAGNVNPNLEVSFNATTGQIGPTGTAAPFARFMTTATTGNLALVRLGQSSGSTP